MIVESGSLGTISFSGRVSPSMRAGELDEQIESVTSEVETETLLDFDFEQIAEIEF